MAGLTEALPIGLIPEEAHVTPVSHDVVDDACSRYMSIPLAVNAQRVVIKVALSSLLPFVVVSSLRAGHTASPTVSRNHLDPGGAALFETRTEGL